MGAQARVRRDLEEITRGQDCFSSFQEVGDHLNKDHPVVEEKEPGVRQAREQLRQERTGKVSVLLGQEEVGRCPRSPRPDGRGRISACNCPL